MDVKLPKVKDASWDLVGWRKKGMAGTAQASGRVVKPFYTVTTWTDQLCGMEPGIDAGTDGVGLRVGLIFHSSVPPLTVSSPKKLSECPIDSS